MESDTPNVKWLEPRWSIIANKKSFWRLFISKGGVRALVIFVIPCIPFLFVAYYLGVMDLAQNRKLFFIATGAIIGFPFALVGMEYLLQYLNLPRGVIIQRGVVVIDDYRVSGELSKIETDEFGHRWLVVQERSERVRVGIEDSLPIPRILDALKETSGTASQTGGE